MSLNTRIRGAQIVLADEVIAVGADKLAFIDADGVMKQESVADLAEAMAGSGLSAGSGVFAVDVDDSSIEIATGGLQIKAGGVTNDMLAGSIADDKLVEDYVKVGEIDGVTLEVITGGTVQVKDGGIDTDQLADGAVTEPKIGATDEPANGEVLTYVTDHLEWTAKTAIAEGYVEESEIIVENLSADIDVTGYDGSHTLANAPVANSVQVFLNGLLQEEGSGKDYEFDTGGQTFTFATQPISGDIILVHYIKT